MLKGPYPFAIIGFTICSGILMLGEHALPGGVIWSMGILFVVATFFGARAGEVGLPPLVGMIFAGFLLRNVGALSEGGTFNSGSSLIKGLALSVIMLRAGFGLDLR